jgi:hypothetical protein
MPCQAANMYDLAVYSTSRAKKEVKKDREN